MFRAGCREVAGSCHWPKYSPTHSSPPGFPAALYVAAFVKRAAHLQFVAQWKSPVCLGIVPFACILVRGEKAMEIELVYPRNTMGEV